MKWFQHDTSALYDSKIQLLGDACGLEGIGAYWALLEEIGRQSDTFHLHIPGVLPRADRKFDEIRQNPGKLRTDSPLLSVEIEKIPERPAKLLAKSLFITPRRLAALIETAVRVGLFDPVRWREFGLLYSVSFERRGDEYSRRRRRTTQGVRTHSGQCSESVRTLSEEPPDTIRTESEHGVRPSSANVVPDIQQDKQDIYTTRQKEKDVVNVDTKTELSTHFPQDAERTGILATIRPQEPLSLIDEPECQLDLTPEELNVHTRECQQLVREWNETHEVRFDLDLTPEGYRKLFCGGDRKQRLELCYRAFKMQGERLDYPGLVRRAFVLMLRESQRRRIVNPFGWLWSCLHGNGDGTIPWVATPAAEEERSPPRRAV
jgi:hypothetical protein